MEFIGSEVENWVLFRLKFTDMNLRRAMFLTSEQFISESLRFIIVSTVQQAQTERILLILLADYSEKQALNVTPVLVN